MAQKPRMKLNEFREKFHKHFAAVKQKYGTGNYSYTEGMTRRSARNIARKLARKELKGQMVEVQ